MKLLRLVFYTFVILIAGNQLLFCNNDLESLISQIKNEKNPKVRLEKYFKLIQEQMDIVDSDILLNTEIAYKLADSLKIPHLYAKALYYRGIVWRIWSDANKSLEYSLSALKIYEELNDKRNYAETMRTIAETYRSLSFHDLAVQSALKAEEIFLKLNDTLGLAQTYNRLAAIMFEKLNNKYSYSSHKFGMFKGDGTGERSPDKFFNTIAKDKEVKMTYDSLVKYIDLAYHYAKFSKSKALFVNTSQIESAMFIIIGNRKQAIELLNKALEVAKKEDYKMYLPLLYASLAAAYTDEKDYDKALEYAKKEKEISDKTNILIYKAMSAISFFSIYSLMGDYKTAIAYLHEYQGYISKHTSNQLDARLRVIEYQHNLARKEQELRSSKKITIVIVVSFILILSIIVISLIALARRNREISKLNNILIENNIIVKEQKDQLEIANAEKDKFFSIVAHDLKNPVGSFRMTTNLLRDSFEDLTQEEAKEMVGMLKESSDSLFSLLENLLEWSRAQRGKINFIPVETDMKQLIEMTCFVLKHQAAVKNISLNCEIPENYYVVLDPNLVTTVVRNLMSNAIKFTPEGGSVSVGIKEETSEHVTFFVSDTGVGIPQENIEKIFRIDSQVTTLGTNQEKGTGLGLILCKEFINLHNGDIWVESQVGKGTTFYIKIPRNITPVVTNDEIIV